MLEVLVVLLSILSFYSVDTQAQNRNLNKNFDTSQDTIPNKDSTQNELLADLFDNDTLKVTYVQYGRRYTLLPFDDSLLSHNMRQIDFARAQEVDYLTLGNIGSPAFNPLFRPKERSAFDIAAHGFELYTMTFDNFKLYRPTTPYTQVRYATTTGVRDDNVFTGKFSRKFAKNLTFNLDYTRINQVGEFLRDRMRNTNFAVGIEQNHWNNRYKTHLIYIYNQFLREENGGVSQYLDISSGPSGQRLSMPVNIGEGGSKYREWGILFNNDLYLIGKKKTDSNQGLHLGYEISYMRTNNLFYDTNVRSTADSIYYRNFNRDIRGVRNNYEHKVFLNRAYLSLVGTENKMIHQTTDYLRGGLALEHNRLSYLPTDSSFSLLMLEGDGHWSLSDIAGIQAKGYYLLNSLTPIFNLKSSVHGRLGKLLQADAWFEVSNQSPSYLLTNLHLNSKPIFSKDAKNTFHTYFGGRVKIPAIMLEASIHQNVIQNYTFIDNNWQTQQIEQIVSVTGIQVEHHLKWGIFHMDNSALWQVSSDDNLRIPQWVSRHAAYVEGRLFSKKLTINIGLEGRALAGYNRMGYSPILFNFYNIESSSNSNIFTYDAFLSYKIRLLRGFIRLDNINSLYDKRGQYQIAQYPIDAFAIRLGFDWTFNN